MRLIMRFIKLSVILLVLACVPVLSHAAEVNVTSSTQYLWYQDYVGADKSQGDVAQYLRLNITKLDKEGKASIFGYGRLTKQVTSDEDILGRFYYLYFDYRDALNNHLDLRLGRSFINAVAVAGTADGAYVDIKNLGPFGVTAFGGREVIFQDKKEIGGGNYMSGASIYLDTVKNTHVEVGYGNKYRRDSAGDSKIARESLGLDISTTPVEMVNLYGRGKYDTIADKFNELLIGAKLAPIKNLILRGEFLQTRPTFDSSSIYTIFAVDKYREISAFAEYEITSDYRINIKYAKEYFGEEADANVYNVGFFARPVKDLSINVNYEKRNGFSGDLSGIRGSVGYDIANAKIQAGIDFDDFTRQDSRSDTAKKYWAGASYQFNKMVGVTARMEYDVNYISSSGCQGFAAVNVNY